MIVPIWKDDFSGVTLNADKWNVWDGTWYPNYLRPENVTIADGTLSITTKLEEYGGANYTAGLIYSKDCWQYFRVDVRAKLPSGDGLLSAIWMFPESRYFFAEDGDPKFTNVEIDIAEYSTMLWSEHYIKGTFWHGSPIVENASYYYSDKDLAQDYHIYSFIKTPSSMLWLVDGKTYKSMASIYDTSFFLILSSGVILPPFTEEKVMQVDWVKIAEISGTYLPITVR